MLVATSGTTGRPKAFLLTHANILHNVRALADQRIITASDRALLPLPLHHVYPLAVGVLTPLAVGATVVLPEGVTGPSLVAALKAGRCTVMAAVPRLYAALLSGLMGRVAAQPPPKRLAFRALFALSLFLRRRFGLRIGKRLFGSIHRNLAPDLWLMASGGAASVCQPGSGLRASRSRAGSCHARGLARSSASCCRGSTRRHSPAASPAQPNSATRSER
jgi:long-chain acyl-CoA synthetase